MFEIEAEEYAKGKGHEHYNYLFEENAGTPVTFANWCFKDGAEFGYNKANEWHYVKDGDLPPLNTNVLVIHRWARTPEVGKRIEVFIDSSVWVWAMCSDRYRYTSDDENVIAWKEIVLPELPKESE